MEEVRESACGKGGAQQIAADRRHRDGGLRLAEVGGGDDDALGGDDHAQARDEELAGDDHEEHPRGAEAALEEERERQLGEVRSVAFRDALTGVKSKHAYAEWEQRLNGSIASGEMGPFAVVVCDVNGLKQVNDNVRSLGHKVDEIEGRPAKRWESVVAAAITAIIAALVGFAMGKFGF